jgi:hypothetical protein
VLRSTASIDHHSNRSTRGLRRREAGHLDRERRNANPKHVLEAVVQPSVDEMLLARAGDHVAGVNLT